MAKLNNCLPRYSELRTHSKLMGERAAKPFWDSIEAIDRTFAFLVFDPNGSQTLCIHYVNLHRTEPLIAILENVYGVLKVREKVL